MVINLCFYCLFLCRWQLVLE